MNMQMLIDAWSAHEQRNRAESQMTLGSLIKALESMPKDAQVANLKEAHSYRGYYRDLAFEQGSGTRSAADLLGECKEAMGQVFQGYKGGDYVMGSMTPVWVASYGCCGEKLIALGEDGSISVTQDDL